MRRNLHTTRSWLMGIGLVATVLWAATTSAWANQAGLGGATSAELAQARMSTARYHDLNAALADGYIDINFFVPGMGFHFIHPGRIDGSFDPAAPEALVYWPGPQGELRLVAVEYLVPLVYPEPAGYSGSHDAWDLNAGAGLWTLHAWLWLENPSGIFAETNPRLE